MTYKIDPAIPKRDHPVGAVRFHGQHTRGERWTHCKVVGHTTTGKVQLQRECNGAIFSVLAWAVHYTHKDTK